MRYRRLLIPGACYFFTVVVARRQPIFYESGAVALLEQAISLVKSRHPFEIEAQVILPDHVHAIWQLPDGDADYAGRWRLIKSEFTRRYRQSSGQVVCSVRRESRGEQGLWQSRYWEHMIRDEADFAAHVDYIHFNPVKHGLVAAPRAWEHSTFRDWVERGVYERDWGADLVPMTVADKNWE